MLYINAYTYSWGKRDVYTFGSYRNIYPLIDNVLSVQMVGRDFDCNN